MDAVDFSDVNDALGALLHGLQATLRTELTSVWLPIQLVLIGLAVVIAWSIALTVRRRLDLLSLTMTWSPYLRLVVRLIVEHLGAIIFILVVALMRAELRATLEHRRVYLLSVAVSLTAAWVVIEIVARLIHNRFVNRVVAVSAWVLAALNILGLLDPIANSLDSVAVNVGGLRVTPLLVLKTAVLLAVVLWVANVLSNFFDRRLARVDELTPSIKVLMGKLVRIALMVLAVVVVLSSVGIDLSVLAWFSGAVGVGLGFGLQKIVSNLVSGIILLADRSIKPGDIISVGDHFGRVGNMGARYTSVDTRDGREYLIPNEDFITQRVANWSYSSDLVRLEVKFNTTYDSDPRRAQAAAVEAALSVERVARKPTPACMVTAFGASAIEYEMWFWIRDPAAGVANVKSDVLLALWDTLADKGVTIPKPGPARVIYEMAREDEPDPPPDQAEEAPADRGRPRLPLAK